MKKILENVNLDSIVIENNGRNINLKFIDMMKGDFVGWVECRNTISLDYQNCFDEAEHEGFAEYVGLVSCQVFSPGECEQWMGNEYRFGSKEDFKMKNLILLCAAGGEVDLRIVCKEVFFNQSRFAVVDGLIGVDNETLG
ncbi:hypothetical protein [Chitiniphilus eburneus]|uniref:Uncharacterized protein n=1 Tax=Chitiniphilus eburneus TaxID=2571148 RepID=A0A4U0PGR2_9NEIS|nr:hypothetical protein [Chitiniphilus eburneus]TJZ66850.1 hypothetical protein FAZ21_16840 [Chitiniphilus eburneus]